MEKMTKEERGAFDQYLRGWLTNKYAAGVTVEGTAEKAVKLALAIIAKRREH